MKKLFLILVLAAIVSSASAVVVTEMDVDLTTTSPLVTVDPTGGPNGESAWNAVIPAGSNYVSTALYWAEDINGQEIGLQFSVSDITEISYYAKDMDTTDVKEWYLQIYTKDIGTDDVKTWYHSLHTAEPGYGSQNTMPSGQWTLWTTDLNGGLLFNEDSLNPGTMLLSELDDLEVLGVVLKAGDTGAGWDYTGSLSTANMQLSDSTMGAMDITYNFVPEPMTMVLLAGGAVLAIRRRKA